MSPMLSTDSFAAPISIVGICSNLEVLTRESYAALEMLKTMPQ